MEKKIVDIKEFKDKAKEGNTDNIAIRKQFSIEVKEVDDENRTIEFVASTPGRDRDMDTINAEGWDLTNYEKNPVMLWAHDYSQPPIGKSVENFIQNGELRQKFQFVEKEIYPFADMVYQMYKKGYLNAVSVGFDPKEWEWSDEDEGNIDFRKQELLETSAVPVPANPEALMVAGMDNDKELIKGFAKEVKEWSHKILKDEFDEEVVDEDYQLEVDPTFHKEDDYMIGETECPHCQGKLYMKASEEVLKVNKSEQSDFHLELKDNEEVETEDKIQVNADELSSLIREKVQEQITKKTGKIF